MKNILGSRGVVLTLGVVAILILVYLAAGLSSLQFKPAESYSVGQTATPIPAMMERPSQPVDWQANWIWVAVVFTGFLLIIAILDPEQRKRLLRTLFRLLFLVVVMALLVSKFGNQDLERQDEKGGLLSLGQNSALGQNKTPPPFIPPHLPDWAVYLVTLAAILAATGLAWLITRWIHRRWPLQPLGELAKIARTTLNDIHAGTGWEDAVVQCYVRMSETVNARRGLARQAAMTPTEFAAQLVGIGLPGEAVRRLTVLFERVRYGAKKSSPRDVSEAVDCLTAILHACREAL